VKLTRIALAGWVAIGLTGMFVALADEDAPPEHKKWMKDMGAANGAIKKGVDVEANANKMASIAADVEKWWANRKSDVAVKSSRDLAMAAKKVADSSKGGDAQAVTAAAKEMNAQCRTCHDAHRVRIAENEYKIK
jgi:cytochrome c556